MLDATRKLAKSWVSMILIGLLVFAFAIWGVGDMFTGYNVNRVAQVGDREIRALDFQRAYTQTIQQLMQRTGTSFTNQQAMAFGIPSQVLGTLTVQATFAEVGDDLNLGISEEELARRIRSDPTFAGPNGQFNRFYLEQYLAQTGLREVDFVQDQTEQMVQRQVIAGLVGNMGVPTAFMEAVNLHQNETRSADYTILSADDLPALSDPTDAELRTFYEADSSAFRAPEKRAIEVVIVSAETIARPDDVTDEQARQEYDAARNTRYGVAERRNFLQLPFPDAEAAAAAAEKIRTGGTFEDVIAAEDKTVEDVTFGLQAREDILDPAIGDTVFSLDLNAVSDPIEGQFGYFLIKLTDIQEETVLPFEDVKGRIKQDLASRQAEGDVFTLYDAVEDARAGGASLREAAGRVDLEIRTIAGFDRQGQLEDGTEFDVPERATILREVFQSDVGQETDPVQLGTSAFAWFEVTDIVPESDRAFDDVRDEVAAAWRADRLGTQLDDIANGMVTALEAGQAFAGIAEPYGAVVQSAESVTRTDTPEGVPSPLARALFEGPDGYTAQIPGDDAGTRIVFRVTGGAEPAFFEEAPGIPEQRRQLAGGLRETLLAQYVGRKQEELGVTVDSHAIDLLLGLTQDHRNM